MRLVQKKEGRLFQSPPHLPPWLLTLCRYQKRCDHVSVGAIDAEATDAATQLLHFQLSSQNPDVTASPAATSSTVVASPDSHHSEQGRPAPFLGDLNPEGVFVEAAMTEVTKVIPVEAEGDARLGFWAATDAEALDKHTDANLRAGGTIPVQDILRTPHLVVPDSGDSRTVIPVTDPIGFAKYAAEAIVQELAAVVRPTDTEWAAMRGIYMKRIYPIFPIFEER